MKFTSTFKLLATCCLFVAMSGCQLGKTPLANLAWWNKTDKLDSKYIEPPSHQFSPSGALAVDDSELPPIPPDVDKTVDSFEQDIAQSYKELTRQSEEAKNQFIADARQKIDETNSGLSLDGPPRRPVSSENFRDPLTPRSTTQSAPTGFASSQKKPSREPYSVGLAKRPAEAIQSSNSNDFSPMPGRSPGMTQYEQLAQQSLQPASHPNNVPSNNGFQPSIPEPKSSFAPANTGLQSGSDFVANNQNSLQPANSNSSFQPANNGLQPAKSGFQPELPTQVPAPNNSGFQANSGTQNSAPTGLQPRTEVQANSSYAGTFKPGQINNTAPIQPIAPKPNTDQQNFEYPTTPYQAFPARTSNQSVPVAHTAALSGISGTPLNHSASSSLNLQGQGSYAPGSVRRPDPINPGQLTLPTQGR